VVSADAALNKANADMNSKVGLCLIYRLVIALGGYFRSAACGEREDDG
jgi:hypothetical protein